MSNLTWASALEKLKPYIFRIQTPKGYGSGFQIYCSEKTGWCGVATALHVVRHSVDWEQPMNIYHHFSQKNIIIRHSNRISYQNPDRDLAVILFNKKELPVANDALKLIPVGKRLKQGTEVGWCGFPVVAPNNLCFFEGHVSSYLEKEESYLVDGVAINGVSGGPAFHLLQSKEHPFICGIVSAYIPSRVAGETLPGVCLIRSTQAFQLLLQMLAQMEKEANEA